MNILDARILLKRSTVAGVTPTIPASSTHTDGSWVNTDIYSGEAFLNTTDQRMFVRTGANIQEIPFQTRYVGESYGGGVIFHTYRGSDNLQHGLICSIVNQSTSSVYSNINNQSIGASSNWDGQSNTNLMKAQTGATSGAWKLCDDYSYGGFSDWYLPAIDELKILGYNRFNVNKTLSTIVGSTLLDLQSYWSSTEIEYDIFSGYLFSGFFSICDINTKNSTNYVRAIRQF